MVLPDDHALDIGEDLVAGLLDLRHEPAAPHAGCASLGAARRVSTGNGRRRCAVPSGVMPDSTSRRKKRFRGPSLGAVGAPPLYPKLRVERAAHGLFSMTATPGRSPLGRAAYLYRRRKRPNRSLKVSGDVRTRRRGALEALLGDCNSGRSGVGRASAGFARASRGVRRGGSEASSTAPSRPAPRLPVVPACPETGFPALAIRWRQVNPRPASMKPG